MKKIFYSAILFPFMFGKSYAQTAIWSNKYGGSQRETVQSMIKTSDNHLVMVGYTESNDVDFTSDPMAGVGDAFMIKTDLDGNLIWAKTFGGSERDEAFKVIENLNGDYIMVGSSGSNNGDLTGTTNHGGIDMFIVAYHPDGSIAWKNQIGGTYEDIAYSIKEISGGYAIVGSTLSNDGDISGNHMTNPGQPWSTTKDYSLMKVNVMGTPIWQKCFGGSFDEFSTDGVDVASDVAVLDNGNLAIVGYTTSTNGDISQILGGRDIFVVVADQFTGNIVASKSIGGTNWEEPAQIVALPNNEMVVLGYTQSNDMDVSGNHNVGSKDIWVAKLDQNLGVLSQRCYGGGGDETSSGIRITSDGGFIFAGKSVSTTGDLTANYGGWDWWVVKTNSDLSIQWQNVYGGNISELAKDVVESTPNTYYVTGYAGNSGGDFSSSYGLDDCWLLKINTAANSLVESNEMNQFNLFPNPTSNHISIETAEEGKTEILDVTGKIVFETEEKNITINSLKPAMYLVRFTSKNGSQSSQRLIVE
jgi:Secretion system C-terminal sorting domain